MRSPIIAATLLFSLCLGPLAEAGDAATFGLLGFSKDGRYLAFEQYGISDGSGAPYAEAIIVDVQKNAFAEPPITAGGGEGGGAGTASTAEALLARLYPEVEKHLQARGIVRGNLGEAPALSRSKETSGQKRAAFALGGDTEVLGLLTRSIPDRTCLSGHATTLELRLKSAKAKKPKTLERDRGAVPKRRACAIDYDIDRVHLFSGRIAVVLRITQQGFEGPSTRYMIVTGAL